METTLLRSCLALPKVSAIRHAGDWLNVVPSSALGLHLLDREFRFCLQYWLGLQMFEEGLRCPVCHAVADTFGDHQVGCGGTVIESSNIIPFGMQFFQQLSQLPWRPEGKSSLLSPAPRAGLPSSTSPAGKGAAQLLWMSLSSPHCRNQPSGVLQKIRATLSWLPRRERILPTVLPARPSASLSSPSP